MENVPTSTPKEGVCGMHLQVQFLAADEALILAK